MKDLKYQSLSIGYGRKIYKIPEIYMAIGFGYQGFKVDDIDEITVGGAELYEPRCWKHHSHFNDV